ncbi:MAG: asparagine synthase (glutamine-hydrolyzing) [Candidatus Omnitrophica bacterium]|nr:asparagine synthase (glutamine-hydrolyzing) [Candidatus Omnitrophota bacterium]
MCGICGIVSHQSDQLPERLPLERMIRVLKHRGPDEENIFLASGVGLGHQRLSVIDIETGKQPMQDPSQRYTLVFNGEIYNFQELRHDLEKKGCTFRTSSDTEVLLQSFITKGKECVQDFVGMFAFAIWDARERKLFAARDRIGKKPFFYGVWRGSLYFGSEIKAILQAPGFPREVEPKAVSSFFAYTYVHYPLTAFRHVFELPPASYLEWHDGKLEIERYWKPSLLKKLTLTEDEASEVLWEKLKESTRVRMISDVPLGAFLSGGIDSSIIVALMSELSSRKVKTFSVGFEDMDYNELPHARRIADQFQTDHHEYVLRPNAADMMSRLVWHYDQPFSDVSALPSFYVAQMARKDVTVVLNGDGGDENFCGYTRFNALKQWQSLQRIPKEIYGILNGMLRAVSGRIQKMGPRSHVTGILEDLSKGSLEAGYFRHMIQFRERDRRALFQKDFLNSMADFKPELLIQNHYHTGEFSEPLDGFLLLELLSYLPGDLLVKMDRATMAYGLEARSPFLDHRIIEFAASLPFQYKLRSGVTKYLLKRMMRSKLPQDILDRPKQGFGVPISQWFRGELKKTAEQILLDPQTIGRSYFNSSEIHRIWAQHQSGEAQNGHRLWSLLMFELWHRTFIDTIPLEPRW